VTRKTCLVLAPSTQEAKRSQGAFNVTVGMVQHPTVATLRYNWAILSRKLDKNAFQI